MKSHFYPLAGMLFIFMISEAQGTVRFVNVNNSTPESPYTSWATAATDIQPAVILSVPGDVVLVTNGIYQSGGASIDGSNRVEILNSGVTVKSVNGPAVTTIKGYQVPGLTNGPSAVRCVFINNSSTLSGFTLTGGATIANQFGGGVKGNNSASALVTNCVIVGNSAYEGGGGAFSAKLVNCVLNGNFANVSSVSVGGGAAQSTLINCLLVNNHSAYAGGAASSCNLIGCTVVSNSTSPGDSGGVTSGCWGINSICYYNSPDDAQGKFTNCCVPVNPAFGGPLGVNCFTNPPVFANLAGGDYHLNAASPCINTGTNTFAGSNFDLDGNPRIIAGTVDVGAYEFQSLIHYVSVSNTTPVSPYTNWVTAATNIQDAVDASVAGDFVLVTNGVYKTGGRVVYGTSSNRVVVDKAITLQSVNGPGLTRIDANAGARDGRGLGPLVRGAYLTNGAVLSGFMITNGNVFASSGNVAAMIIDFSGGGIWCESTNAMVTNCVLINNTATYFGGAAYQGTLNNCMVSSNTAGSGGGTYLANLNNCALIANGNNLTSAGGGAVGGILNNCLIVRNAAPGTTAGGFGGGTYYAMLNNCVVSNNTAEIGGGVFGGATIQSLIIANRAAFMGGGAESNLLVNCVLNYNYSPTRGGGAVSSVLVNCTVVSNYVDFNGGGMGGGLYGSKATNCIIYDNLATISPNALNYVLVNCCTTPLPTNGWGNITNEPAFVNTTNDYHLNINSPCINSGNNSFIATTTDFDGNARIAGGTVDIGAYEYQSPASMISYAYLQQYGLPTDGTADTVDSDGDGFSNAQEWRAGTSPIDASSLLQMTSTSNSVSGATITWQSVAGVNYLVQRGADLSAQPAFTTIQSNVVGQAGTTSYMDTNAVGATQFFYRVGVQ